MVNQLAIGRVFLPRATVFPPNSDDSTQVELLNSILEFDLEPGCLVPTLLRTQRTINSACVQVGTKVQCTD